MKVIPSHRSSIGDLEANIVALLCYLAASIIAFIPGLSYVAWLAPLGIYFVEKKSEFVKFHALQAFALNAFGVVAGLVISMLLSGIAALSVATSALGAGLGVTIFIGFLASLVSLFVLALAAFAMTKAYKYYEYKIPVIGGIAVLLANKVQVGPFGEDKK